MTFEYFRPQTFSEAFALLREGGDDARVVAGGQSLIPMINLGLAAPESLIDLSGLSEMRGIVVEDDQVIIGGGTRHRELLADKTIVERVPMLSAAAAHIGSPRIRNIGTLAGSLAHGDPTAELLLVCMCLDAELELRSADGARWSRVEDFALGYYMTDLQPGEILTRVSIPVRPDRGWGFEEYARRAGDFALAAAAATMVVEAGAIKQARVVVSGASDRPLALAEVEQALVGGPVSWVETVAERAGSLVDPAPDPYVDADYRRRLIAGLAQRALQRAVERAEQEA